MRVATLLSGGVDSSVALRLLLEAGHEPTAFYLKIWLEDELAHLGECPWEEDLRYAREVCAAVGVPLEIVPLQREYHDAVVAHALDELRAGHTPSPDIVCNARVKFGAFLDYLEGTHGDTFDRVASGHYARLRERADGRVELLRGVDPVKDQTYFLHRLDQDRLRRLLFPVGERSKSEVRRLAERFELPNRGRPDSQGICFLGRIRFDEFVAAHLGERPGPIRRIDTGETLGEHRGHWFHTIGQRKGLGLHGGPWYVVAKDVETDTVWISHRRELPRHRRDGFRVASPHWIVDPPTEPAGDLAVRVRHGPRLAAARFRRLAEPAGGVEIELATPDPGLAAGQSAVFYRGEVCLGGGVIDAETVAETKFSAEIRAGDRQRGVFV